MEKNAIIAALVISILLGFTLWFMVFRKSEEPEPEPEPEVTGPSPETTSSETIDATDEAIMGGNDEPVPDEDETKLDTAPAEDEVEEETTGEVSPYMIKK
jgi:cytoskeletal protein RodZ